MVILTKLLMKRDFAKTIKIREDIGDVKNGKDNADY
jgi:hypothetical protein